MKKLRILQSIFLALAIPFIACTSLASSAPPAPLSQSKTLVSHRVPLLASPAQSTIRLVLPKQSVQDKSRPEKIEQDDWREVGYPRKQELLAAFSESGSTLAWKEIGDQLVLSFLIESEGAEGLRVGIRVKKQIPGLSIKVADVSDWSGGFSTFHLNPDWISETYGNAPLLLWTPITEGSIQAVEISIPKTQEAATSAFDIENVSHIHNLHGQARANPKLLSCHQNYTCSADQSIQQSGRAVARIFITRPDGRTGNCSGALINDTISSGTPYFATANHCLSLSSEAAGLQFHWYFEQACGGTTTNPAYSVSLGSQLLYTARDVDFTLLRVTGNIPSGLLTLGWNVSEMDVGTGLYGIHHPDGARKASSTGQYAGVVPSLTFRGSTASQTWTISAHAVTWTTGTTEPGSSGSPLITGNGIFRGALSAGPTAQTCSSNPKVAFYSRFSQIFPRIRSYLDPTASTPDEPNSPAQVTSTQPITGTLNAQLHFSGDQDWYRFTLPQRGVWLVFTLPDGGNPSTDTVGRIYGSDGVTLQLQNDDDPELTPNFGIVAVGGPGTFFVQVTGKGSATGRYLLASIFVPDDDHSNFSQLATNISPNSATNGAISYGGDSDHFAIDVPSAGTLQISSTGSTDVVGLLYSSAGQLIASNDDISPGVNQNFSLSANVLPGKYILRVIGYDIDVIGNYQVRTSFTSSSGSAAPVLQGAWWGGPPENGWGLSFIQHGNTLVAGWYLYNSTGQPTWYIMPGCTWNAGFTTCNGNVVAATGSWLGAYNTAQFQSNVIGTVSFTFSNTTTGAMNWVVNGIAGQKNISKIQFGSGNQPTATNYTDVWWGGSAQNGWGVAIIQEGAQLAGAWYTFNQAGQPVWYLFNGGTWTTPTTHTASLFRSTGSPLIGAVYNPNALVSVNAGAVTFSFTGASNASMTYTVDGVTQTKPIERLPF